MMIELSFTPERIEELHYERFNHPPPRVQLKMEAIYLRGKGFTSKEVCDICKISKWTLINYTKDFVLDNAKYQRCNMVLEHAEKLGIELLFLPSCSPNLNLIERFWKLVKKRCLNCRYYNSFECFNSAIADFIKNADTKHHSEMKTLLSWNFQNFDKVDILTD